jgi:hypothetical protein
MSYQSSADEFAAVKAYIVAHPDFPSRDELVKRIRKHPKADFAFYLVAWLAAGDNWDSVKAIYTSKLNPETVKKAGVAMSRVDEDDAMRAMHYVLADFCFPGADPVVPAYVRAKLNSLWDGIGSWSS